MNNVTTKITTNGSPDTNALLEAAIALNRIFTQINIDLTASWSISDMDSRLGVRIMSEHLDIQFDNVGVWKNVLSIKTEQKTVDKYGLKFKDDGDWEFELDEIALLKILLIESHVCKSTVEAS